MTDRTRVLYRLNGTLLDEPVSPELAAASTERALPMRQFFAWPGKRNYEGSWWSSTVRGHVVFESLLEREFLLAADYDPEIVGISAQPMALLWPKRTDRQKSHVPDFFVRLAGGDGRVIDVRAPDHVDASSAAQFELTRQLCGEIGWQYQVFTGIAPVLRENLRWLSGFRQDRFVPSAESLAAIRECFAAPTRLRLGVFRVGSATPVGRDGGLANVLHLLWHRRLSADLDIPLSLESEVWA